ncbi:hypothetical protein [Winogradskyella sp.]|nr:hypothetical protein [Winogradskyella sp.]
MALPKGRVIRYISNGEPLEDAAFTANAHLHIKLFPTFILWIL